MPGETAGFCLNPWTLQILGLHNRPVKIWLKRLAYIFVGIIGLWAVTSFVATTAVVGNHPEWRREWAQPQDFGLIAKDVSFLSSDGISLKAWFLPAQGVSRGTVILAHGIDGNRSYMLPRAQFLVRGGFNVLDIDLRAHGESSGNYASPGYLEARDILAAVSYLQEHGQPGPIIAMGHSYGAVAGLWAAAQSPDIAAVISDSAYVSLDEMARRATLLLSEDPQRSFWVRMGLHLARMRGAELAVLPMFFLRTGVWVDLHKTDTISAVRQIRGPILFISGEGDLVTTPDGTRRTYDAARSPEKMLLIVPGADHDSTYKTAPQLYETTILAFLQKALEPRH
jgi:dipeptidyl aminopeptidase/acylaminoacyl peptidase